MESIREQSAKLLALVKKSGVESELVQRVFDQDQQRRRQVVADIAALPDRDKVLGPLAKDIEMATDALRTAELKYALAEQVFQHALCRSLTVARDLDGRKNALNRELEETAPECLRTTYQRIDLMKSNLRHCCRATHERMEPRAYGGGRLVDIWNTDLLGSVGEQLDQMLEELRALMRRVDVTLPKLEKRAAELLRAAEAKAEPILKDAPHDVYRRSRDALFPVQQSA